MQQQLVFIVSTGSCRSALLSDILNQHKKMLSPSEFFMSINPRSFTNKKLNGLEFCEILSLLHPQVEILLSNNT